jgi:hypothetical protein
MPQPLLRIKKVSSTTWGSGVLGQHPKLAALIMHCIASWSQTEVSLGTLLAYMLGLRTDAAFAAVQMYLRLNSAEARRSVIDAAAQSMLTAEDYKLFDLTMRAIKPVRSRRNDFAHGIWGVASEIPDGLLWVISDDHLAYESVTSGAHPKLGGLGLMSTVFEAHDRHRESIMVYRAPDLEANARNAAEASMAVKLLGWVLHPFEKPELSDARRQELLNLNLIRAVSRSGNGDENIPAAQLSLPPENPGSRA